MENLRVNEDRNDSSLVSCSVSLIRSTFRIAENSLSSSKDLENFPRLDLFLSSRDQFNEQKKNEEFLQGQNVTRRILLQRSLTRADHNGTIQCQVESTNNQEIYLIKRERIDIQYGPNFEAGAAKQVQLESEVMKMITMECQIEANPSPSYVWYEVSLNQSIYGQSVFGTRRDIQRLYQYPGRYSMQCQAQSNGKTIQQEFFITVQRNSFVSSPFLFIKLISFSCNQSNENHFQSSGFEFK